MLTAYIIIEIIAFSLLTVFLFNARSAQTVAYILVFLALLRVGLFAVQGLIYVAVNFMPIQVEVIHEP
jgi:hypothetical protein